MLDFKELIKEIVASVPNSLAGMIIGRDGIIIEQSRRNDKSTLDIEVMGVEFASIIGEFQKAISIMRFEEMKDVTITLQECRLISHMLTEDYFLILIVSLDANEGLCRHKIRVGSLKMRELF